MSHGRDQDVLRKKRIKILKEKFELKEKEIGTISIGLKVADFLDVSFNLNNNTYKNI